MAESNVTSAGFFIFKVELEKIYFLLLESAKHKNRWSTPKGHLEAGETSVEAAFRETREETGLHAQQLRLVQSEIPLEYSTHAQTKRVRCWIAELTDSEARIRISSEHREFRWAEHDQARQLIIKDAQPLLDQCHELIMKELMNKKK